MKFSTDEMVQHLSSRRVVKLSQDKLASLQALLLCMADDVIGYCEKTGIDYTLSGGTCLGAVRHGGFIPWDDDIDVNITRRDFERFCVGFERTMGHKYEVFSPATAHDYGLPAGRVVLKGTRVRGLANIASDAPGAYIDIFIVENAPNSPVLRAMHGAYCLAMGFCLSCRRYARFEDDIAPFVADDRALSRAIAAKAQVGKVLSVKSLDWWTRAVNRAHALCENEESKYITVPSGRKHYFREMHRRADVFPARREQFCGRSWLVPRKTENYLRRIYGKDFMTPQPPALREHHAIFEFDLGEYAEKAAEMAARAIESAGVAGTARVAGTAGAAKAASSAKPPATASSATSASPAAAASA